MKLINSNISNITVEAVKFAGIDIASNTISSVATAYKEYPNEVVQFGKFIWLTRDVDNTITASFNFKELEKATKVYVEGGICTGGLTTITEGIKTNSISYAYAPYEAFVQVDKTKTYVVGELLAFDSNGIAQPAPDDGVSTDDLKVTSLTIVSSVIENVVIGMKLNGLSTEYIYGNCIRASQKSTIK